MPIPLVMALAAAAAEKTAETSYAIYLYWIGGTVAVGGSGAGLWWYCSSRTEQPLSNPLSVEIDLELQRPLVLPTETWQCLDEQTDTLMRLQDHQATVFYQTLEQLDDVQLHANAMNDQLEQSIAFLKSQSEHTVETLVAVVQQLQQFQQHHKDVSNQLQRSQLRLQATEDSLSRTMSELVVTKNALAATSKETSLQCKNASQAHQQALLAKAQLTNVDSLQTIIKQQAGIIKNLTNQNNALMASDHSTRQPKPHTHSWFGCN